MSLMELNVRDPVDVQDFAASSISAAGSQADAVVNVTREASSEARGITHRSIDILYADLMEADQVSDKDEVIQQFRTWSGRLYRRAMELSSALDSTKLEADQGIGFYLLLAGRDPDLDPADLHEFLTTITSARKATANAKDATGDLIHAIERSAAVLPELDAIFAKLLGALRQVRGELYNAEGILGRHIMTAERLYKILTRD